MVRDAATVDPRADKPQLEPAANTCGWPCGWIQSDNPHLMAVELDAADAALIRIAQWGRDIEKEPRNEGKLIDTIRAGRIGGNVTMVLAAMRAGRRRVLVARAGADALWNLAIDRDLHPPDTRGHGQLHLVNIALICEEGGIGEILAAIDQHPMDAKVHEDGYAALAALARGDREHPPHIAAAGGLQFALSSMRIHRSDASLCYQCCAFVKALVAKHGPTRKRAVDAGALEAIIASMAAHPELVVLQGVGCWTIWLLLELGPEPEPEPKLEQELERPQSAAMSVNSASTFSSHGSGSGNSEALILTQAPEPQFESDTELEPEPEPDTDIAEEFPTAEQLETGSRVSVTFEVGPMGVKWSYPNTGGLGPFTLAFVAEGMQAACAGLIEGMQLVEVGGLSMGEWYSQRGFDNAAMLDKMVKTRPLTLVLQVVTQASSEGQQNLLGNAHLSLGHTKLVPVPGLHTMPNEDNPPLDMYERLVHADVKRHWDAGGLDCIFGALDRFPNHRPLRKYVLDIQAAMQKRFQIQVAEDEPNPKPKPNREPAAGAELLDKPQPRPQIDDVKRWLGKLAHPSEWMSNRWVFREYIFAGSFSSVSMGEKVVEQAVIAEGVAKFKKHADKYVAVMYQSEMVTWPEDQQKYTLVARAGTVEFKPTGIAKDGAMTCVVADPKPAAAGTAIVARIGKS